MSRQPPDHQVPSDGLQATARDAPEHVHQGQTNAPGYPDQRTRGRGSHPFNRNAGRQGRGRYQRREVSSSQDLFEVHQHTVPQDSGGVCGHNGEIYSRSHQSGRYRALDRDDPTKPREAPRQSRYDSDHSTWRQMPRRGWEQGRLRRGRGRRQELGEGSDGAPSQHIFSHGSQIDGYVETKRSHLKQQLQVGLETEAACLICCQPMKSVALGQCGHRQVCAMCTLRNRLLYSRKLCPLCNQEQDRVILAYPQNLPETFDLTATKKLLDVRYDLKWAPGVFVISSKLFDFLKGRTSMACKICWRSKKLSFDTFAKLQSHLRTAHGKQLCSLCHTGRGLLPLEAPMYDNKQLAQHLAQEHPRCEFCNRHFVDDDALWAHMQQAHHACTLCQRMGIYEYFLTVDDLRDHLRANHFICNHRTCVESLIAFDTEEELAVHVRNCHPRGIANSSRANPRHGAHSSLQSGRQAPPQPSDFPTLGSDFPALGTTTAQTTEPDHPTASTPGLVGFALELDAGGQLIDDNPYSSEAGLQRGQDHQPRQRDGSVNARWGGPPGPEAAGAAQSMGGGVAGQAPRLRGAWSQAHAGIHKDVTEMEFPTLGAATSSGREQCSYSTGARWGREEGQSPTRAIPMPIGSHARGASQATPAGAESAGQGAPEQQQRESAPDSGMRALVKHVVKCQCGRKVKHVARLAGKQPDPLICDTQCQKQQRRRQLADAFDVGDPEEYVNTQDRTKTVTYSPQVSSDSAQLTNGRSAGRSLPCLTDFPADFPARATAL